MSKTEDSFTDWCRELLADNDEERRKLAYQDNVIVQTLKSALTENWTSGDVIEVRNIKSGHVSRGRYIEHPLLTLPGDITLSVSDDPEWEDIGYAVKDYTFENVTQSGRDL